MDGKKSVKVITRRENKIKEKKLEGVLCAVN
jgi:hypothetical protein